MRALALLGCLLLAGCLGTPAPGPVPSAGPTPSPTPTPVEDGSVWGFGGAWTTHYTSADIDAWCEIAKAYNNTCTVMESFPPQYAMAFPDRAECHEARAEVLALRNITARECVIVGPPPGSIAWVLGGSMTAGYTAQDVDGVCRAATGNATCAMMKSEPPQFSFRFPTSLACETARERVLAVPHTRVEECRQVPA